jgi:hypothetical protein
MRLMDIAVNLVQSYLRLNGYLTMTEFEVQGRSSSGGWETITDVDVVGLRFPGEVFAADVDTGGDDRLLLIDDDLLELSGDQVDVIIGEVKQGDAVFNPGLKRHEVLHSVLRRLGWLFAGAVTGDDSAVVLAVVGELQRSGLAVAPARGGGDVRVRLVTFGQSDVHDIHTIPLAHVVDRMVDYMKRFDEILRPAQFKEPAPALLRLLVKAGFAITEQGTAP